MAVGGAQLVAAHPMVVGQLELGMLGIATVAEEGEAVLLRRPLGRAQQLHAEYLGVEGDRALQVADAQHGVEQSHRGGAVSRMKQVVDA